MSPLEIDFERYQRRIAELEAEVERLKEHCTMFCVCNEHLPVPLDRKGRPALVSARRKETSP